MRKKKIHWGTLWLRFARKCRLHPPCNWHDTGYKSQCKGYAKHMTRIPSENGVLGCKCNHSGNHAGGCECVSHRRSTFNIKHFFFYPYRECMYCNVRGVDTLLLLKCNMGIFLFLQAMGGIISPRWCNNYTRWLQNVMLIVKVWHVSLWITYHCCSNGNSARAYFFFCPAYEMYMTPGWQRMLFLLKWRSICRITFAQFFHNASCVESSVYLSSAQEDSRRRGHRWLCGHCDATAPLLAQATPFICYRQECPTPSLKKKKKKKKQ